MTDLEESGWDWFVKSIADYCFDRYLCPEEDVEDIDLCDNLNLSYADRLGRLCSYLDDKGEKFYDSEGNRINYLI